MGGPNSYNTLNRKYNYLAVAPGELILVSYYHYVCFCSRRTAFPYGHPRSPRNVEDRRGMELALAIDTVQVSAP